MSLDPITKKAIQDQVVSDYLKGQKIDAHLKAEAESFKAGQLHQNQILNRGPRDRSMVDEIFADRMPDVWSLGELKKKGIEAFYPTRSIGIGGHGYGVGDVLLLWPAAPVAGFATREQLQNMEGSELEPQFDESWIAKESFYLSGHQYQRGQRLMVWPDTPTRGFIRAQDALQFLKDGDITPAELTPAEA